jgi:RNA polymerase sigma-70 factor, ECF subfamily
MNSSNSSNSSNQIPANDVVRDTLDDALIARIARGDASAMSVLYARHNLRVYRFAMRLVANPVVAEEVTSEVFLDVWRKSANFEGRCQVSTWLLAVTRHKALQAMRPRRTEPLDGDTCDRIADTADDPETAIDKSQKRSILFNCLSRLSVAHREVVDLVYYHQKTIDEVAAITGLERNTVKTRMFYARKHLAELLGAQGIVTAAA